MRPVCMKYTAQGNSRVANKGEVNLYLSWDSHQELYTFIESGSALSVLLYFPLEDVLTEDTPLKFSTFIEYKKLISLMKMCQ